MKNLLIVITVLLLTTGIGFAQNNAVVKVKGNDNEATVTQVGNNDSFLFQGAAVYSSLTGNATENTAKIEQTGTYVAFLLQGTDGGTAKGSEATITQSGSDGFATVFQGILYGKATSLKAIITQHGSGNQGNIRQAQVGNAYKDKATLTQNGSGNFSSIFQGFGSYSSSENNTATVIQNGNNNYSGTILQGAFVAAAGPGSGAGYAEDNTATVIQNGNGNYTPGSGVARIHQGINGASASNNTGYILQNGDSNAANIFQGIGTGIVLRGSDATIIQNADNGIATINQRGVNHSATITQN